MIMVGGLMFGTLAKFEFGRSLLEAYPRYLKSKMRLYQARFPDGY